ncbi:MAG: hypothetical protein M3340_00860 [Actinomycetota bacterium]|nr:hypothetical protein [Actinomycetota bacterium]
MAAALTYVERLLDDDYVQDNLGEAAVRLQAAYRRARDRRAAEAVQDAKLYEQLRGSAAALVNAVRVLGGEPPPKRRRWWWLAVPALGLVALAARGKIFADPPA